MFFCCSQNAYTEDGWNNIRESAIPGGPPCGEGNSYAVAAPYSWCNQVL